ncbi:GAF domain-containing sensor histidine kinase [Intrasporangium sp.]|uniref:sensor histidine kinase n=1 Tax=Intrasporangium sp. TaxID=1925024 RepID=UPI0029396E5D|nr:GAF domain-containing sensor histidine kinase [Intrasporangium sp.]MDV3221159.1 GAF domain-containing sensor histidine kinase [Intrasporangium sp.]
MGSLIGSYPSVSALQDLAQASVDGLVVFRGAHVDWANRAARSILGVDASFADEGFRALHNALHATGADVREARTIVTVDDAGGRRLQLDTSSKPIGEDQLAVWFRDLGEERAQQDRITAIATAALGVADAGNLDTTLNTLAREVREAADLAAVQVVTMHNDDPLLRIIGRSGFQRNDDFTIRLDQARKLGAHLTLFKAVKDNVPVIVPHRKAAILSDPLWAPMHEIFDQVDWDCFGAFPITARERVVGVLIAFFKPGRDPDERTIEFVSAMAEQAALAVDYAALIAISRDEARRRERERIASDLHDAVVQRVFSMRLLARALHDSCDTEEGAESDDVRDTASELVSLCRHTLADLRDLIFELRPTDLAQHGFAEAIKVHANAIEARAGLKVDVLVEPGAVAKSANAEEDIYRIVQEALHNVVKHAGATRVAVVLRSHGEGFVEVTITDNGRGLGSIPSEGPHIGITSMRERARKSGGSFTIDDAPDGGVMVKAIMPVGTAPPPSDPQESG